MLLRILFIFWTGTAALGQTFQSFHDFKEVTILGDTLHLSSYAGKKVLVVNTASFCGYTPQFTQLQILDSIYKPYGFHVIGFPCNDFGNQDPHNDSVINNFCQAIYGVQFQMMHKVDVVSGDTAEVYKWLQNANRNGVATALISWNFNKFLIDRQGKWVRHFTQTTNPLDTAITNWIKAGTVTETIKPIAFDNVDLVNPTDGTLRLLNLNPSNLPTHMYVFSLHGKLIESKTITSFQQKFEIPNLPDGCYRVKISGNSGTKNLNWLVRH